MRLLVLAENGSMQALFEGVNENQWLDEVCKEKVAVNIGSIGIRGIFKFFKLCDIELDHYEEILGSKVYTYLLQCRPLTRVAILP